AVNGAALHTGLYHRLVFALRTVPEAEPRVAEILRRRLRMCEENVTGIVANRARHRNHPKCIYRDLKRFEKRKTMALSYNSRRQITKNLMHDLEFATVEALSALPAKKKVSPVELTELYLSRIERLNPNLNAFITVTPESALAEARAAEKELSRGRRRGVLHGIPVALKDNIWTKGVRTTMGSLILRDFLPSDDATVVRKLRRAGAIVLGKTNLHEFAYGVTSENPHYGRVRNPWNTDRTARDSSGGSAAAVAAGLCAAAIGR